MTQAEHEDEEEHEEGEPWLVSYADLMTLLFGFFVLMYTFATAKIDKSADDFVKVRKEVAAYFSGRSVDESEEEKERETSKSVDAAVFRPLLNLLGSTSGSNKKANVASKLDPREVLKNKQQELKAMKFAQEGKILGTLTKELSTLPLGSSQLPPLGTSDGDNEYILSFSSDRMFNVETASSDFTLTTESMTILQKLVETSNRLSRPMRFSVEAFIDPRAIQGSPTLQMRKQAFETTSKRTAAVLETLLKKFGSKATQHVYSASGYGFLDPSRLDNSLVRDRILVRVAMLPEK